MGIFNEEVILALLSCHAAGAGFSSSESEYLRDIFADFVTNRSININKHFYSVMLFGLPQIVQEQLLSPIGCPD